MTAKRCGDHGVEIGVVDVDAGLLQDHHVEVCIVGGFGNFGIGEERGDDLKRAGAVDLFAGTMTDGYVAGFALGVRERHADHLVLHRARAVGLGVICETVGIAEAGDQVLQLGVGGDDGVVAERSVGTCGFGVRFSCDGSVGVAEEIALRAARCWQREYASFGVFG